MPQRVNIDYDAFANAQNQLNSFYDRDLLSSRAKIKRTAIEEADKKKKKQEIIDAGLLIASMFVLPGISGVKEGAKLANIGAKEVAKEGVKQTAKKAIEESVKETAKNTAKKIAAKTTNKNILDVVKSINGAGIENIITNPLKKGFWEAANRKFVGKEFMKGAFRQNKANDMFTLTLGSGEEVTLPRSILKTWDYLPENTRDETMLNMYNLLYGGEK